MVRVSVEVREGDDLREVTVYADSISQAVGKARDRFPGRAVRVVFPIDGEEFFGRRDTEAAGPEDLDAPRLLAGRVTEAGMDRCEAATIHHSWSRGGQVDA